MSAPEPTNLRLVQPHHGACQHHPEINSTCVFSRLFLLCQLDDVGVAVPSQTDYGCHSEASALRTPSATKATGTPGTPAVAIKGRLPRLQDAIDKNLDDLPCRHGAQREYPSLLGLRRSCCRRCRAQYLQGISPKHNAAHPCLPVPYDPGYRRAATPRYVAD